MSVKLILPCDGADNSTTFVDESPIGNTITAHGTAKISTASPSLGTGAAVFDGVGGTYLSFPDTSDFDFSGDFTIRFRVKLSAFNPNYSLMLSQSGTVYAGIGFGLFIEINDSGNLYACVSYNGISPAFYTNLSMPCQLYIGTYHDIEISAYAGNLYVYRDTVRLGSVPLTAPIYHDSSRTFHLGGTPSLNVGLIGSLDQIYINNGESLSQGAATSHVNISADASFDFSCTASIDLPDYVDVTANASFDFSCDAEIVVNSSVDINADASFDFSCDAVASVYSLVDVTADASFSFSCDAVVALSSTIDFDFVIKTIGLVGFDFKSIVQSGTRFDFNIVTTVQEDVSFDFTIKTVLPSIVQMDFNIKTVHDDEDKVRFDFKIRTGFNDVDETIVRAIN